MKKACIIMPIIQGLEIRFGELKQKSGITIPAFETL